MVAGDEKLVLPSRGNDSLDSGQSRLNELGYKQELKRELS